MLSIILVFCLLPVQERQVEERHTLKPTPDKTAPLGVYVPHSLEDALLELSRMLHPEFVSELRATEEDRAVAEQHFGLGLWMRNHWALWKGSRLKDYFLDLGIFHPDDMTGIILTSYWRKLNNKPIELQEQVRSHRLYWIAEMSSGDLTCPLDKSKIPVRATLPGKTWDDLDAPLRAGRCLQRGHLWAHQFERGLFRPTARLLEELYELEAKSSKPWR